MKLRTLFACLILVLLASVVVSLALAHSGLSGPEPAAGSFAPGRLLVKFQPWATQETAQNILADHRLAIQKRLPGLDVYLVAVPDGEELSTARQLKRNPAVRYAEPDYLYHAFLVPNDPYYASDQWNLPHINAPAAWDITTGSVDLVIAIVDTGIDLGHPDLSAKIVAGHDFVNDDDNAQDDEGHGTHVAGIAAALSNNATGVAGVSWGSRLMPVKVLDENGSGYVSDIAEGIHWAADHGAKIINMSLGGPSASATLQEAVNYAYDHGLLIAAAAGNEYNEGNPTVYPAAFPHVVAVAAINDRDGHASYSNTGPYVDVAAPGGDPTGAGDPNPRHWIMSTYLRSAGAAGAEGVQAAYERHAGTSMATPHVAGLAALVWSQHPGWTNDQVEWAIESTARDLGDAGPDDVFGWGRIDAQAAVALPDLPPTPTATPSTCLAESAHPYPNNANQVWTITNPDAGAQYSRIRFSRLELETCCDFVVIRDEAGNEFQRVTGNRGGFWSSIVPGRTIQVQLLSDSSVTGWGFCVNQIETMPPPAWAIRASLGLPRSRLAVAAANGKVYAIGGESATSAVAKGQAPAGPEVELAGIQDFAGRVEEYDPATNTWTTKAPMPIPLSNVTAATIEGKIYVPGGWNDAPSSALQIYDPATDRWSAGASLPVARSGAAAAALDGQLYVLGGGDGSSASDTCYRYDPAGNRWTQCASMRYARLWPGAGAVNGRLYVAGGIESSGADLEYVEEYDPAANRWTTRTPMQTPRGGPGATGVGDYLYVVAGGWTSYLSSAERYDPVTDSWEAIESLNVGRRTLGLAELDGKLYAVAGWNGFYSGMTEAYTLPLINQPAIRLAPGAFNVSITTGETTTRTLTIRNAGQVTLTFDIRDVAVTTLPTVTIHLPAQASGALPVEAKTKEAAGRPGPTVGQKSTPYVSDDSLSYVSHGLVAAATVRVLIVSADGDVSDLLAVLNAFPDLQASRYAGPAAPALADLLPFDVVLTSNNRMWLPAGIDPDALGDALADYIDRGGKVITANYAYDFSYWGIGGRFAAGGYGPFGRATADLSGPVTMGITLTGHPILQGVTTLREAAIHQNPPLAAGAILVASWNDGTPLGATRPAVVGLNLLPSLGNGTHRWSGDAPTLLHNAVVWLADGVPWLNVSPVRGLIGPGGQERVTVSFDASLLPAGRYTATLLVNSNDPIKSLLQVPVIFQVVPPPPEIEIAPIQLSAKVAPGSSTDRRLTIRNTGRGELSFAITETLRTIPTSPTVRPTSTPWVTVPPAPTQLPTRTPGPTSTPWVTAPPAPTARPASPGQAAEAGEPKRPEPTPGPAAFVRPAGGPDPFGYTFRASTEVGGPVYRWVEIAPPAGGDGTEITSLTGRDDSRFWPLPLPFSFNFYGGDYTQMAVNTNGALCFEDGYLGTINGPIPTPNSYNVNRFIAHFWDDLVINPGAVYYLAEPDRLIIEYYHVSGCCLSPDWGSFEVILFSNGNILFQYQDVLFGSDRDRGGQATVGIQGDASTGLQFSYNTPALADGLAICFAYPGQSADCAAGHDVPWLTTRPIAGIVPPAGSVAVQVGLDAADLSPGVYGANLEITSNDPDEGKIVIPVTLTVTTQPGEATLFLAPATVHVEPGQAFTLELRVASGQQPLDAVDVALSFDPAVLRGITPSGEDATAIVPGNAFSVVLRNQVNNPEGRIFFSAGRRPGEVAPGGDLLLGIIRFRAITETLTSATRVSFLPGSDVFYGGNSVLLGTADSTVTVHRPYLVGRVRLQGRGSPPSARPLAGIFDWQGYPLRLVFYAPGSGTPVASYAALLDATGVFTATDVVTGVYDITVKNAHSLSNRRGGVVVSSWMLPEDFGMLLEGDVTDDDRVAGDDFSALVTAYGTSPGQPRWDPRADFTGDGVIGGADFSLLVSNYGLRGPIPVTALAAEPVTRPAEQRANILIRPSVSNVEPGAIFTVDIAVQAGSSSVDSVDARVSFDRTYLRVVDVTGNETTGVTAGSALPLTLQNSADNGLGQIVFSAGRQPDGVALSGDFVLATIRFKAVTPTGSAGTSLAFGADADVFSRGSSITGARSAGLVVIGGPAGVRSLYMPMIAR